MSLFSQPPIVIMTIAKAGKQHGPRIGELTARPVDSLQPPEGENYVVVARV